MEKELFDKETQKNYCTCK